MRNLDKETRRHLAVRVRLGETYTPKNMANVHLSGPWWHINNSRGRRLYVLDVAVGAYDMWAFCFNMCDGRALYLMREESWDTRAARLLSWLEE